MAAVLLTVQAGSAARAEEASDWDAAPHSAARLIAGLKAGEGGATILRAGVEIRLDPGWKTYWRYPGDAGIPPRLDFARSDNVKAVSVAWPAPERFVQDGIGSIGYQREVIFPLRVVPADPARPAVLRVKLDYAVCEKLCMPVEATAELVVTGREAAQEPRIAAAEAAVPRRVVLGREGGLSVRSIKREPGSPARIVVDVAAPADAKPVDLFAEGPAPDWALPLPEPVAGAPPGLRRFAFALDGLPPGAKADGSALTLTAVAGGRAIEVSYRLD